MSFPPETLAWAEKMARRVRVVAAIREKRIDLETLIDPEKKSFVEAADDVLRKLDEFTAPTDLDKKAIARELYFGLQHGYGFLEAVLSDILSGGHYYTAAMSSTKTPRRNGFPLDIKEKEWKLINLIEVSVEVGVIPETRAKAIDQILSDFRNFIHPKKELRAMHSCSEAEAFLAKGALDSILNHLEAFNPANNN